MLKRNKYFENSAYKKLIFCSKEFKSSSDKFLPCSIINGINSDIIPIIVLKIINIVIKVDVIILSFSFSLKKATIGCPINEITEAMRM